MVKPNKKNIDGRKIILLLTDKKPRIQNEIVDEIGLDHANSADRNRISKAIKNINSEGQIIRKLPTHNVLGHPCTLNNDIETLKRLIKEFSDTEDEIIFHHSSYAQDLIVQNSFDEFIKNFHINMEEIQKFIDKNQYEKKQSYTESLRETIIKLSTLSPAVLRFLLTTKINNNKEKTDEIVMLFESSFLFEKKYGIQIKWDLFLDKYGKEPISDLFQNILSKENIDGWKDFNYCEYIVRIMKTDAIKDVFKYSRFYLNHVAPHLKVPLHELDMQTLKENLQKSASEGEKSLRFWNQIRKKPTEF